MAAWQRLAQRSLEPNGYQLAAWLRAVDGFAHGRGGARALMAWNKTSGELELLGVLPVVSAKRFYGLPLPALVSSDNYSALSTPLIDAAESVSAARDLIVQARSSGARALVLRDVTLDGPVVAAFTDALASEGLKPRTIQSWRRASLDARGDAEAMLQTALGVKKLKELRRLRKRLAETGEVVFSRARTPQEVADTVETFLTLESSGWKGQRGTALLSNEGDTAFIRNAVASLAASGQCEIITLQAGTIAVAAAVVIRHRDRAYYYKLGIDDRFAKYSPGVQLTLELTRAMCADPEIALVDSTAGAGNAMIEPIWQGRIDIGDVLIPLRRHDPLAMLIYSVLVARLKIREPLVLMVRKLRNWRKKQQRIAAD
jgi:CelD/BcsL family acetyltransferase involved in cellulose biosynthesis